MNIESIREYCLALDQTTEDMPFGDSVLAFRIHGKIFALLSLEREHTINLKCNPEKAIELRNRYPAIIPGYHMNKKHWNTLYYEQLPEKLLQELIRHAYDLIRGSLPGKYRRLK